ncbi:MAG: hypothetical protein ACYSWX_01210 [Planctomycetota bacterium]|jgi:hypothetical protein
MSDSPDAYPMRRAFLMLSLPFTVLGIFVLIVVLSTDDPSRGSRIDSARAVERRVEGIAATERNVVQDLIGARTLAPAEWSESQRMAFAGLVERTGYPAELDESLGVTSERLSGTPPSEWNEPEREIAAKLLEHFQRYWLSPPQRP